MFDKCLHLMRKFLRTVYYRKVSIKNESIINPVELQSLTMSNQIEKTSSNN